MMDSRSECQAASQAAAEPPPAALQQAAAWMARLWADDASEQDRAACARWRAQHPDHEQAWQALRAFEDQLDGVPADAARQALRPATASAARRRAMRALGLGALLAGAGYAARGTDAWQGALADYRSGTGEISALVLPDGTRLTLSTASAIDVRFSADERRVLLRHGEILVETAADPAASKRPFLVQGRDGVVQALGTRFTVREDADTSRVAVFDGAVEIRPARKPDEALRLRAGQGARYSRYQADAPAPASEDEAAWSRGVLVADTLRLDAFIAELSRYRSGLLRCDPEVAGLLVSGVFSLRDTDRALANLARVLPVTVLYRTRYWVTVRAAQ